MTHKIHLLDDNGSADLPGQPYLSGNNDIRQKVEELFELAKGSDADAGLYREMLLSVMQMAQADRDRWDAKIMLQTIRELEQAFSRLEKFKHRRKVTVFGSARTQPDHTMYRLARELGQVLAKHDFMAITGGGSGIMEATHVGAGLDNSLGFNITLPFEQKANCVVSGTDHDLKFKFFFLRKLFFVKEADALVLFPGGFGTLDETLEILTLIQTGKSPLVPVILLDEPGGSYWQALTAFFREQLAAEGYILESDLRLMQLADSPEQAMQYILDFYRNYHSSRWLQDKFIMRLQRPLTPVALADIQRRFADMCSSGLTQDEHTEQLAEASELGQLHHLAFAAKGRDQGRLRELIDFVNHPGNLQS